MNIPAELRYTPSNEWLRVDGSTGTIGITDYAQSQLSDIVFTEIVVNPGDSVNPGDTIAVVESVKAAADVYSPVSGKVSDINEVLTSKPETINSDPYGSAWMVKLDLINPAEVASMLDAAAYEQQIETAT